MYFFALGKLARIFLLKEVKPSPDRKMKKNFKRWFTYVHYLVLRKYRIGSRPRLGVSRSLLIRK